MDESKLSPDARALLRALRKLVAVLTLAAFVIGFGLGWYFSPCADAAECTTDTECARLCEIRGEDCDADGGPQ